LFHEPAGALESAEQHFNPMAQVGVVGAGSVQICGALGDGQLECGFEDRFLTLLGLAHGIDSSCHHQCEIAKRILSEKS
jgi:hypothetical protein